MQSLSDRINQFNINRCNRRKTERLYTPVENMKDLVRVMATHGDKVCFRYYSSPAVISEMTYAQVAEAVKIEAAAFSWMGLAGKRIAIIGDTSPQWLISYLAAVASGSVAIPMDKELFTPEIEGLLASVSADAIIYSRNFNSKFENMVRTHPSISCFIPIDMNGVTYASNEKVIGYDAMMQLGRENAGYDFPDCADVTHMAEMLFTSGTTGTSKCVMLSEQNILASACSACASVDFGPDDVVVSVLPVHHTYELCCLLALFDYGGTICINDSLKHVLKNFKAFRPTGLVLVPLFVSTMYKKILDEAEKSGRARKLKFGMLLSHAIRTIGIDVRSTLFRDVREAFGGRLSKMIVGGAPLNPQMCSVFEEFGIHLCEGYGITECSPLISVNPYYRPKPGSVGLPVPSCQVRIIGDEKNERGFTIGEIAVKGTNVMLGYYNNPEANAEVFTEDGWFLTGDIGYIDNDGYIYITGRKKSVIVLENGKNVFPEEIEEYIANIEGVLESVVVGRRNEGEETVNLTAIIVPDYDKFPAGTPSATIEKMLRDKVYALNRTLASFKQIRAVEIRETEFEKTTTRKIRRHLVK